MAQPVWPQGEFRGLLLIQINMMKSLYFGQCEECGKWYLVRARQTNNDGAVRCLHCKKWSQNWNDSLWSVGDFIKQLKRFPKKAPIFFAAYRDKPALIYQ